MGRIQLTRELAAKLDKLGRDLNNPRVPLNATALHVKRVMETTAAAAGALGSKPRDKRS